MNNTVHVGNLPYSLSDSELAQLFISVGPVCSANVIRDRSSGRSKGFGFVILGEGAEIGTAIEKFDGYELEGRSLRVNPAKPKPEPRRA